MKRFIAITLTVMGIGAGIIYWISSQDDKTEMGNDSGDSESKVEGKTAASSDHTRSANLPLQKIENSKKSDSDNDDDDKAKEPFEYKDMEGERQLSDKELDRMEEYFQKAEQEWSDTMKNLIVDEFKLGLGSFREYQALKEGFEADKVEAFDEFHEYMQEKHGENYTYNPTEDEQMFAAKINQDYLDRLRKLLGPQNFDRYLQVRDKYNEKLKKEMDPEIGVMLMDM